MLLLLFWRATHQLKRGRIALADVALWAVAARDAAIATLSLSDAAINGIGGSDAMVATISMADTAINGLAVGDAP